MGGTEAGARLRLTKLAEIIKVRTPSRAAREAALSCSRDAATRIKMSVRPIIIAPRRKDAKLRPDLTIPPNQGGEQTRAAAAWMSGFSEVTSGLLGVSES